MQSLTSKNLKIIQKDHLINLKIIKKGVLINLKILKKREFRNLKIFSLNPFISAIFSDVLRDMFHERKNAHMATAEKRTLPKLSSEDTFTSQEVADLLHLSLYTLGRYRREGTGPLYIDLNHKVKLYPRAALYQWMAERARKSTSDPGVMVSEISEALEQSSAFLPPASSVEKSPQRKRGRPRTLPPVSSPQQPITH